MDYNSSISTGATMPQEGSVNQELNITRAIVKEIKSHVMELIPSNQEIGPKAAHKLLNLKNDIRDINRELEDLLKAVSML